MSAMAFRRLPLFLGMLYYISPAEGQKLTITPQGSQVKDLHSRVILSCSFEEFHRDEDREEDFDIRWIGPNIEHIHEKHGRIHVERIDRATVKLYINRLRETDAGLYSCQLNANGQLYTATVQLSLYEDIRFDNKSAIYHIRLGEKSALLECSAFGFPLPEISWRFNRTKIPEDGEKYAYEKEGLRIYDVTLGDNGTYECRAQVESQGSLKIRYITLDVLYPPVITEPPSVVDQVVKGRDAVLQCGAHGNPPVRYEWLLETRMSDFVKAKVPVQRGGQMLTIRNFDSDKEGRYFCRVSNSVGMKESYLDITMLVPPVVKDLGNHVTVEGRTLILPCELINGRPSPDLFWTRVDTGQLFTEGSQADDASMSVDVTHRGVSKLIIRNIQRSHAGVYTCLAVNAVGNSTKIATISVDYVPRINSSLTEVFGWTGQVRNLTCVADGQPLPVVSWSSRGQHVFDTVSYKIETTKTNVTTSILQITIGNKQPWVFGNYTCIAKNHHGSSSVTFQLRESDVPDLPHNVSVLEVSDVMATLLVAPPAKTGGIPITSWMIKYEVAERERNEKTAFFDPDLGANLTTMTVTHLSPDTEYTFYLAAGNDVGFGQPIKFLVKTHQKSVLKEQSDVPQKSGSGGVVNTWRDPAALEKSAVDGRATEPEKSSAGVIFGVISAVAILVLVFAGVAFWVRRHRSGAGLGKLLGFGGKDPSEKRQKEEDRLRGNSNNPADKVLQMAEVVGHPSEEEEEEEEEGVMMKGEDSYDCGFDLSPRPERVWSPATQVRSLTVTPSSVRRFTGERWGQTHESNDDISSGFGTAEPESIQSDLPAGTEDESIARGVAAQRDPDLDSIPDIDDEELDKQ